MTQTRDWLTSVVRILEADTGDLRQLALIGGADPTTFYIGTNLDGVDIRGQDLRGMALPGLDLSRVRSDDATLVEDQQPPLELQQPLIFIADPAIDPRAALARDVDAALYAGSEKDHFLQAALAQRGPILLIFSPTTLPEAAPVAEALRELERPFVAISVEPPRRPLNADMRRHLAEEMRPLVSVQRQSGMFMFAGALSGEIRDLIRILIAEWANRDRYIEGGAAYFLRATGTGADPLPDAAAQIFDRLWQMRVPVRDTTVFATRAPRGPSLEEARLVMSRLLDVRHLMERSRPAGARLYDLAVFTPLSRLSEDPSNPYQAVVSALVQTGWKVEWDGRKGDRIDFQMAAGGPVYTGRMSREAGRLPIQPRAWPAIDRFSFTDLDALVLTPEADIATVAERMVIDREFWVTSRDLLAFSPGAPSLWLLLAGQMRRMGRSIDGRGRQLYLRLLLSAAFEAQAVSHPEAGLLNALTYDSGAFEFLKVSVSGYAASPGGARCRLRISQNDGRQTFRKVAEADLLIDAAGVRVSSPGEWSFPRRYVDEAFQDWVQQGPLFSLARVAS